MGLSATIHAAIEAVQSGVSDLGFPTFTINPQQKTFQLANGSAAGQANLIFSDTRTIAASGTDSLDLAGVLVDALGATLTFAHVKAIFVKAHSDNVNDVVLGAGSNPVIGGPFGVAGLNTINVQPGGIFEWFAPGTGMAVTAATGDILKVANSSSGTAVNYDIIIIGV